MKQNIIAASVLGLCLIVAAIIYTGRYYFIAVGSCSVARADRWTGEVTTVRSGYDKACKGDFEFLVGG